MARRPWAAREGLASDLAIVGDVQFRGSVGRADFPYCDSTVLLRSIRRELFPLGDDVAFLCDHGPGLTTGVGRRTNPHVHEGAR